MCKLLGLKSIATFFQQYTLSALNLLFRCFVVAALCGGAAHAQVTEAVDSIAIVQSGVQSSASNASEINGVVDLQSISRAQTKSTSSLARLVNSADAKSSKLASPTSSSNEALAVASSASADLSSAAINVPAASAEFDSQLSAVVNTASVSSSKSAVSIKESSSKKKERKSSAPQQASSQGDGAGSLVNLASTDAQSSIPDAPAAQLSSLSSIASSVAPAVDMPMTESLVVLDATKTILGVDVKPGMSVRLTWSSESVMGGFSEETPVLVINGAKPGKTLCLTGAVHGDELNGIEMIRRVIYGVNPEKLTGTLIGVPVANIMGFRRNSRYLPDRRDWNRYFPGNTRGSAASRLAHSFFTKIIWHCDALVDIHTGSFHRTNLLQLRADLSDENVARLAQNFGAVAVLNTRGNPNSLRAAAVRAGVPSVTIEAGEPMAMQREVVVEGAAAINELLANLGMYGKQRKWNRIAPVYYKSAWVRANQSGILFSSVELGDRVNEGDVLGTVTDPITNARSRIVSLYKGRVLGMALDQVVLPGFAAYHIGIQTPESILIEESQLNEGTAEEDEEDGDDSGVGLEPVTEVRKKQAKGVGELTGGVPFQPKDKLQDSVKE